MRLVTLGSLVALIIGAGFFALDVGVCAFALGSLLLLLAPHRHKEATGDISWPAVLLVCGMLTYMSVLKDNGTLALLGDAATSLGMPLLAALLLCLIVGLISAFGSSIGTLGIALPIAFPLLATGHLSGAGFVIALAFCSTVVDVSPFSTNGVIVLAQAQVPDKQRFQRRMFAYTACVIAGAPLLSWAVTILPPAL